MRWFKHFSDNHRGQSVQLLLDKLGYFGPFFYYLMFELCSEKLEAKLDAGLTPEDCEFVFHQRVVCSASRAKPSTVGRALDAGQSCGLWTFSLDHNVIKIKMPILLNLLDSDSKKPRLKRDSIAMNSRLEKNKMKSRVEKNKIKKDIAKTEIFASPYGPNDLIALYCDNWKSAYVSNTSPVIRPQDAKIMNIFLKTVGKEKAEKIVNAYFKMPDKWFLTKKHDIRTMLDNTNSIIYFIESGKIVTGKELNSIENSITTKNLIKDIEENGI